MKTRLDFLLQRYDYLIKSNNQEEAKKVLFWINLLNQGKDGTPMEFEDFFRNYETNGMTSLGTPIPANRLGAKILQEIISDWLSLANPYANGDLANFYKINKRRLAELNAAKLKENKSVAKIRLTEGDLKRIIKNCVNEVVNNMQQQTTQQANQQVPQQQNLTAMGETQLTNLFKNAITSNNVQMAQQIAEILETRVKTQNIIDVNENYFGKNEQGVVCGTRIGLPDVKFCNDQQKNALKQLLTTWYSNTFGLQVQGYDPYDFFESFGTYISWGLRSLGVKVQI